MSDLRNREFNPLKILHHIDRIKALAAGRDIAPVTVEIDPVAYCNHACSWCVDPVHVPLTMPNRLFESLITELAEFTINQFRVEGIVFKGGGEPLLHPNFDSMVERAAGLGFAIGVVTNGSLLTRWADILSRQASYVRISIDGPTAESHARIHQSRDFDQIVAAVNRLIELKNGRRHPIIGLSFAMDIHFIHLAEEAIRLGERLQVDYVLLRPPFFAEVGRQPSMTIDQAREVRRRLFDLASAYDGPLDLFIGNWIGDAELQTVTERPLETAGRRDVQTTRGLPIEHLTGRCWASPILAVITADGTLYGCCNLRALSEWSMGRLDYVQKNTFRDLWQGRQRKRILDRMHRTECIRHCTHPLRRYNDMIDVLKDVDRPHSQFV